jgi:hypothetical protein
LVARDKDGEPSSVRYDQVNAMLLNEFLKEHKKVQKQGAAIARQREDFEAILAKQKKSFESKLAKQERQIEALASGLQNVTGQIEGSEPPPRVVVNEP